MSSWQTVIGLEIHAQILSKSKLFSRAATTFGAEPNDQVNLFDAAIPGTLPVLNFFCIEQAVKTGLALGGEICLDSWFDRKNYFYPDLPSGYQISQYWNPLVKGGGMLIQGPEGAKHIRLNRIHVEQDAGKSIHDQSPYETYIDLNRAGIALMEIVTEPDFRFPEEAADFVKKLRVLLRYLGTCDGNMEEGSLRVDINVSLNRPGEPLGTRVEVKNVNSIRFMVQAINYEVSRQSELLESGSKIKQETRLFENGQTRSMRSKENVADYRYFPDPDLPSVLLEATWVKNIKDNLPELPSQKLERYRKDFGLGLAEADSIVVEKEIISYFEDFVGALKHLAKSPDDWAKIIANWFLSELFSLLNKNNLTIDDSKISAQNLADLVILIENGKISGKQAKDIIQKMWEETCSAEAVVAKLGIRQISDPNVLRTKIREVLAKENVKVQEYLSGKDKLVGFFIGLLMKETQGNANPEMLNKILGEELAGLRSEKL